MGVDALGRAFRYAERSPKHVLEGVSPLERWREVTAGLPPSAVKLCALGFGSAPGYCDDVVELKRSKALLHIKVCAPLASRRALFPPAAALLPPYASPPLPLTCFKTSKTLNP
jgi:hypothetical protein